MRSLPSSTLVAVIDIQQRLTSAVPGSDAIVERTVRLVRAASMLGVRLALTEQYPKGLGPTVPAVADCMPRPNEKRAFSAAGCTCLSVSPSEGMNTVILAGLETHVCILQTALDLLEKGLVVFVAVDAVGSRFEKDHEVALRRLEASGGLLTTTEAILFEWCRDADHQFFRDVRSLITGA